MLRMHFLPALAAAAFLLPATAMNQAIAQPIYRCGNTYSQEACKGGKVVEDKTTTLHSGHSGSIIYLCKGHGGWLFWSSAQCGQHNAFLERTETVPFGPPWDQKVAQAKAQWRNTQRNIAAPVVSYQTCSPKLFESGKNQFCDQLDSHMNALENKILSSSYYYHPYWKKFQQAVRRNICIANFSFLNKNHFQKI